MIKAVPDQLEIPLHMRPPDDSTPLIIAREWLRERVHEGERCPCCNQFAKVYKRTIHATMARDLIVIYKRVGRDWFHLPEHVGHPGDFAKLRYWNLIHERTEKREDGGRAGWWRVNDVGLHWVYGAITVPKYAHIYDGKLLRHSGSPIDVQTALGKRFDYRELMET